MKEIGKGSSELGPAVGTLLEGVRSRLRLYVLAEGAAWAVAFLGAAFWFTLTIDRWRIPLAGRQCLGAIALVVFLEILRRRVVSRLLVPMTDRGMAVLLERRYPQFGGSLLSSVEFAAAVPQDCDPDLLRECRAQADAVAAQVLPTKVFRARPLIEAGCAGLLLLSSVGAYAAGNPRDWAIWNARWVRWLDVDWPRSVLVELVSPAGLKGDGQGVKVAKGSTLDVEVRVGLNLGEFPFAVFPATATVHPRSRDRLARTMDRVGDLREGYVHYKYTFPPMMEGVDFEVKAGDGMLGGLRVDVVEIPVLTDKRVTPTPPPYLASTGSSPREIETKPEMSFPRGTRIRFVAEANKPLVSVEAGFAFEDGHVEPLVTRFLDKDHRKFECEFVLDASRKLLLHFTDTDGIRTKNPDAVWFEAKQDEPPQIAVRLKGIGSAITPNARLPVIGKVTDDHGMAKTWFGWSSRSGDDAAKPVAAAKPADPAKPGDPAADPFPNVALRANVAGRIDWELQDEAFEVQGLPVKPGDKLSLELFVQDGYDLILSNPPDAGKHEGPNVAHGERFPLDVVTPDQLRVLLETREVSLRKRFEVVRDEVREARSAVSKLDEDEATPAGAEGEVSNAVERKLLRVERAVQGERKNGSETLGIAVSFFDIVEELENNRIDDDELRTRLGDRIARPLKKLADQDFAELDRRLERLRFEVKRGKEAEATLPGVLDSALAQYDAILSRMEAVLEEMRQLEDFNEALALLRDIIDEEDRLMKDTSKERVNQAKKGLDLE